MPVIFTDHAETRSCERFSSAKHGKSLFRKALKSVKKGKARQFQEEKGRIRTVWNKLTFIHTEESNGNVLVTLYKG